MKISDLQNEVNKIVIRNPCAANWDDMHGDQTVRFCRQCKKNVHNLSAMNPEQLAFTLELRERQPTCVFMARANDGSVVIDNCPKFLRKQRDKIRAYAYSALLTIAWLRAQEACGQTLVGAPVDPRYGQAVEVGALADFGYDTARDISRIVTALSAILVWFIFPIKARHSTTSTRLILAFLERLAVPLLVHLAGTYMLNNYGGLGGGGI